MNKFVIYKRLSKQKSEGNQYGFDSQQADFDHFLKSVPDNEVIAEFGEFFTGKGDWKGRKELVKAVKLCKETGATLLVSKVDRLGRNVASVAKLLEEVDVKVATMPSATNMVVQILASVAEEEVRSISSRVSSALKAAKAKGVLCGAAVHKNKTRRGVPCKRATTIPEVSKVKFIIEMNVKNKTYAKIAEILNQEGLLTESGKKFTRGNVFKLCEKWRISR